MKVLSAEMVSFMYFSALVTEVAANIQFVFDKSKQSIVYIVKNVREL